MFTGFESDHDTQDSILSGFIAVDLIGITKRLSPARYVRYSSYPSFVSSLMEKPLGHVISRQDEDSKRHIERACAIVQELGELGIVLNSTNFILSGDRVVLAGLAVTRRTTNRDRAAGLEKDRRRLPKNRTDRPELMRQMEEHLEANKHG